MRVLYRVHRLANCNAHMRIWFKLELFNTDLRNIPGGVTMVCEYRINEYTS